MPFYALRCRACGHTFEQQATIRQRTERELICPACGSRELAPDYTAGSAHVVRRTGDASACPHQGQCGCGGCCGGHA